MSKSLLTLLYVSLFFVLNLIAVPTHITAQTSNKKIPNARDNSLVEPRTVFVTSRTVFFKPDQLINELGKRPAFKEFDLSFVNERGSSDLILEIDHTLLTYKFSFKLFDREKGTIIATGNVIILDGNLGAPAMADRVLEKLRAVKGETASIRETKPAEENQKETKNPPTSSIQQTKAAAIKQNIKNSRSNDLKISEAAAKELIKLDADSLPMLIEILKKSKPCEAVVAGQLIFALDPNRPELVPIITRLTRGASISSLFNLQEEMMCRRGAAYLLDYTVEGITSLTDMLKNGDIWEKQTAIFALDELTETRSYPKGSTEVMKTLIPIIASCQTSKDDVLRNMSGEVLSQISHDAGELGDLAKKLIID